MEQWPFPRCISGRPAAERTRELVHFFSRSARHVLVEEGTRSSSYLTLPTISHSLIDVSTPQHQFLDDQRKFATFIYIRPRFTTSCSAFPKLRHPLTLAIRVRAQYIRRQMKAKPPARSQFKPPPHSIGPEATASQHRPEATAAQHRARSHRRAASGQKPPPRRIGPEVTAAPHRTRSHCRAASGKKPQPHRLGQEATAPHRARSISKLLR